MRFLFDLISAMIHNRQTFYVNTNRKHGIADQIDMINNQKAAVYYDDYLKRLMSEVKPGDPMFLYENDIGFIALGFATGTLRKLPHGEAPEGEYSWSLSNFYILPKPLSPATINRLTNKKFVFASALNKIDPDTTMKFIKEIFIQSL